MSDEARLREAQRKEKRNFLMTSISNFDFHFFAEVVEDEKPFGMSALRVRKGFLNGVKGGG